MSSLPRVSSQPKMPSTPAPQSQEARVERYVRLAPRLGPAVHGFELLEGRGIRVLTQPLAGGRPDEEDEGARWLRENG